MTNRTIKLTDKEIDILLICLCDMESKMKTEAERLKNSNKSGINTEAANTKIERANDCNILWRKLFHCIK